MAILNVGPDETYPTIAAAMAAAQPGDEISLEAGYSGESAVVTVDDLFVSGGFSSKGIDLTLGAGVSDVTLLGDAPIHVDDNSGNNTITGNAGNNIFEVSGGTDVVHGGGGIDRLIVDYSSATSTITGTTTNITDGGTRSVTFDGIANLTIDTGSGDDTITAGNGNNVFNTGGGNDTITSGNGHNRIQAGAGNDTVSAGNGGNIIRGGGGNDTITSGSGNDIIHGGAGDDTITGGAGNNMLYGGAGNDTINGGTGSDHLFGGRGINILNGGTGNETADYSDGSGVVVSLALSGAQAVNASETDTLTSIDNLKGSRFSDTLTGNSGNNVLNGGRGADHLNGDGGSDTFVYASALDSTSTRHDTITGFDTTLDRFHLSFAVNAIDTEVTAGQLSNYHFDSDLASAIGATQLGAHDAVLFTPSSGKLAGDTFLIVDANGVAGYQAGQDLVIQLDASAHLSGLSTGNFI